MSKRHLLIGRGLVCLALVAMLVASAWSGFGESASAFQGNNLLQNPGFEEPYIAINGDDTLRVAANWRPWSLPQGSSTAINARPEYRLAPANRVRSGGAAQQYGTFYATHTGGLYQRVPVTPNIELQFSAYIYVWSSASFYDPDVSDNPNDVRISVGIDPFGGIDGNSSDIVWSPDAEFYDQYREMSITAAARNSTVTVFIRTAPQGFNGTTEVYVDDARLLEVGQIPPTSTPPSGDTFTPPPTFTPDLTFAPTQEGTLTPSRTPNVTATNTPFPSVTFTPSPVVTATRSIPDGFTRTVTYVVRAGDTVSGIASRFGSTVNAIGEVNGLNNVGLIFVGQTLLVPVRDGVNPQPATLTPVPTRSDGNGGPTPSPGFVNYTVLRGDTLSAIAARYNSTINTLAQVNNIVNPNLIFPGQVLLVPGGSTPSPVPPTPSPSPPIQPTTHVVQVGENLFRISLRYNVTINALVRANGIPNPSLIYPGQVLTIPR
ncbi:MAG: LysM peptidoglycan-binding domain-containing protein [Chloroflexi bacterium]|nr:LysM peptidoglycan-binding domain-containing protein [Chloroflexota bacterium]